MTKIWLLSDLHQEFLRDPYERDHPGTAFDPNAHVPADFDVVVLAGDIEVPLTREVEFARTRFPGVPVILVPGNHSFYGQADLGAYTIDEQLDAAHELADKYGIHLLENGVVTLNGTRFIGATLWTDMTSVGYGSRREKIGQARNSRNGMRDYKEIKRWSAKHEGVRKRLRPEDTISKHIESRRFIESQLKTPHEGRTVVVTHHAPHPDSLDAAHTDLNWCYASRLGFLMEEDGAPDIWLHGHIHRSVDYTIGRARVISNPRGYQFVRDKKGYEQEGRGFDPSLVVEVAEDLKLKP